jgi:hypothetical protein
VTTATASYLTHAVSFSQPANGTTRPATAGIAGQISSTVIADVKHAAATAPRSLQTAPGPSELGTPCLRRLAYKILDSIAPLDKPNTDTDPWLATIGTSVHAWMAATYQQINTDLGRDRYLIEHRVHLPYGISGSCDLFDRDAGRVIDWKLTSLDNIRKYRKNGPGDSYRKQGHLYGLGMQLAGETVSDVAVVFLPRGGSITDLHVWTEPYNPGLAVRTLQRYEDTKLALGTIDPEAFPDRWVMFPTADAHCAWCPFYLPFSADLSKGCPGHKSRPARS